MTNGGVSWYNNSVGVKSGDGERRASGRVLSFRGMLRDISLHRRTSLNSVQTRPFLGEESDGREEA